MPEKPKVDRGNATGDSITETEPFAQTSNYEEDANIHVYAASGTSHEAVDEKF